MVVSGGSYCRSSARGTSAPVDAGARRGPSLHDGGDEKGKSSMSKKKGNREIRKPKQVKEKQVEATSISQLSGRVGKK
jgi:hypothetical protein